MSILIYAFSRLSFSPRTNLIDKFNREVYGADPYAPDVYVAARDLIVPYRNDFSVREIYKQGAIHLKDRNSLAAMELCTLPLEIDMQSGFYFRQNLLGLLIDICEQRLNDNNAELDDLEYVIEYLDLAAATYSEHPEIASNALNMAFDVINNIGLSHPKKAASMVARHFPHESYMFADNIVQQLNVMPRPA